MSRTLLARIAADGSPVRGFVSKAWRRYTMRHIGANDNHAGLDQLYALPDPWGMTTAREQSRFEQTNGVITSRLGRPDSVLEIGSGEGHQSEHLASICNRLDGLDVSARAVERAQERVPHARFAVGHVPAALPWAPPAGGRYDLVVACEVLYYVADIPATVAGMSRLGHACLATFFCPSSRVVARHLQDIPGLERGWIYHDPYAWLWAFWRPDQG